LLFTAGRWTKELAALSGSKKLFSENEKVVLAKRGEIV
jgi:hypothetical protein